MIICIWSPIVIQAPVFMCSSPFEELDSKLGPSCLGLFLVQASHLGSVLRKTDAYIGDPQVMVQGSGFLSPEPRTQQNFNKFRSFGA